MFVKYVSNGANYGGTLANWSPSFLKFVQAYMADEIVGDLTNSKTIKDDVAKEYKKRLNNAQGKDGVNRPTQMLQRGDWNRSRRGSYSGRYEGSRRY